MNKAPQKRGFWYVIGPYFLYWGVEFVGSMLAALILLLLSAPEMVEAVNWADTMSSEEMMQAVTQMQTTLLEQAAHYQVQMLALAALCTIPVMAFLFHRDRKREKVMQLPVNKKAPLSKYVWIVLLGLVVCIGVNGLVVLAELAFGSNAYQNASAVYYVPSFLVQILCLGIVVPLSEELIFRGILFKRSREWMSFFPAAFSISLLFGFHHGTMAQFLYALALGMLLCYVYEKYGSLKAPVLLHITANLTSLVLTETGTLTWMCSAFFRMAAAIIFCAFLGAVAFVLIQKIDEKPENSGLPDGPEGMQEL